MAKTIKEMAHEHVVAYMHNDEYKEMEDTYIAGANAVLEKVEEILNLKESELKKLGRIALLDLLVSELKDK